MRWRGTNDIAALAARALGTARVYAYEEARHPDVIVGVVAEIRLPYGMTDAALYTDEQVIEFIKERMGK